MTDTGSKAQAECLTCVEDLTYLIEFLDANLHAIADATLYDVAAVAGDVATLGRLLRKVTHD